MQFNNYKIKLIKLNQKKINIINNPTILKN